MEDVLKLYVRKRTSFENVGDPYQNNSIPVYQIRFHHSLVLFREALQKLGARSSWRQEKPFSVRCLPL